MTVNDILAASPAELNRIAAEQFMGWRLDHYGDYRDPGTDDLKESKYDWDPYHRWDHAGLLLDELARRKRVKSPQDGSTTSLQSFMLKDGTIEWSVACMPMWGPRMHSGPAAITMICALETAADAEGAGT